MPALRSRSRSLARLAPLAVAVGALLAAPLVCAQDMTQALAPAPSRPHDFRKWEKDISAFENLDRRMPPPTNPVLFVGSSTVVRWQSLAKDFPETPVLNRGFGGSEIADSTYYAERIIFPYNPRMIVLRSGVNDIHAGRSPEEVFNDFKAFITKVRTRFPKVPVAFVAVNPSPSRWSEKKAGERLNALVAEYVKTSANLVFIDISRISLNREGQVRSELFEADRLHFNQEGYKLLASAVRPHVDD